MAEIQFMDSLNNTPTSPIGKCSDEDVVPAGAVVFQSKMDDEDSSDGENQAEPDITIERLKSQKRIKEQQIEAEKIQAQILAVQERKRKSKAKDKMSGAASAASSGEAEDVGGRTGSIDS